MLFYQLANHYLAMRVRSRAPVLNSWNRMTRVRKTRKPKQARRPRKSTSTKFEQLAYPPSVDLPMYYHFLRYLSMHPWFVAFERHQLALESVLYLLKSDYTQTDELAAMRLRKRRQWLLRNHKSSSFSCSRCGHASNPAPCDSTGGGCEPIRFVIRVVRDRGFMASFAYFEMSLFVFCLDSNSIHDKSLRENSCHVCSWLLLHLIALDALERGDCSMTCNRNEVGIVYRSSATHTSRLTSRCWYVARLT